jgi:DNA integrity scanning protein DisA with diadenylate cyclase activity
MAKKIFSYVEKPLVGSPIVEKVDNTITDDVIQLGNIGPTYYFSFDDINGNINAAEESEVKIYDLTNEEDLEQIKSVIRQLAYVAGKVNEFEKGLVDSVGVYTLIKGVKDSNQSVFDMITQVESAKDAFLQSLGFPGVSILD